MSQLNASALGLANPAADDQVERTNALCSTTLRDQDRARIIFCSEDTVELCFHVNLEALTGIVVE